MTILYILITFLLVISLMLFIKHQERFIFFIPIINILIDILTGSVPRGGFLAFTRASILLLFIFYIMKYIRIHQINSILFIFLIYLAFLIPFSSNFLLTTRIYLQIFISMMMLPIAFLIIRDFDSLQKLNNALLLVLLIFIINTFFSTYFHIGIQFYSKIQDSFMLGNIQSGKLYTPSIILLLMPSILLFIKRPILRKIIYIISIITFIILLLSVRRTAVISVFLGYSIYFLLTEKRIKVIIGALPLFAILYFSYPLYENLFLDRIVARSSRFQEDFIEKEARYSETFFVYDEIISDFSIHTFFGKELFNSPGNYAGGIYGERQLHVDYNVLLHGSGLIGLFLYLLIFIRLINVVLKWSKKLKRIIIFRNCITIFFVVIVTSLFISVSGQMYEVTFRSIIFLYLGSLLGIFENYYININQQIESFNKNSLFIK